MRVVRDFGLPIVGAVAICGGALWGMASLVDQGALRPANVQELASTPTYPAPDPEPAPAMERQPVAPSNVVRSQTRSYSLPSADTDRNRDVATYNALQRNCYEAARNNQGGEYPALQEMACTRYAGFAASKGWNAGALPDYGKAQSSSPASPAIGYDTSSVQGPQSECSTLLREKEAIDERMRHGYSVQEGEPLRDRLQVIRKRLWERHCRLQ